MALDDSSSIQLQPYPTAWWWRYRGEWLGLRLALNGCILGVEHYGRTALPGMIAKPIIDFGVMVPNYDRAFTCVRVIERLGYTYLGENLDQRSYYFTKGHPGGYHLYVYELHSADLRDRSAFRDCRRRHPDIAYDYAELKRRLMLKFPTDLRAYQEGKLTFVQQVLHAARFEYQENE